MPHNQEVSSAAGHAKLILLVEDDPGNGAFLVEAISEETPYQVVLATDSVQALEAVKHLRPGLFILDYHLASKNGIELYDEFHAIRGLETVPAIILSASLEIHRQEIEQRQLVGLGKPLELDELLTTIDELLA